MKTRKGFTLVEVLIVIIIIGILAAAMLFSGGSATDAAEASRIISDLRGLKSAALMLYFDSYDTIGGANADIDITMLKPYVDNPEKLDIRTNGYTPMYTLLNVHEKGEWWLMMHMPNLSAGVMAKLEARAADIGLYRGNIQRTDYVYEAPYVTIYMRVH